MARGKYAARAANTRAESATERAERLERQLAEERAAHAREVADLKNRVQQLSGQLTREVGVLAAVEVQRAKDNAQSAIAAEREDWAARARAAIALLDRDGTGMRTAEAWDELRRLLRVSGDDYAGAIRDSAKTQGLFVPTREEARGTGKALRQAKSRTGVDMKNILKDTVARQLGAPSPFPSAGVDE